MGRVVLALVVIAACSKASDESQAKQWPEQKAPAKDVEIPANLSIALVVDGAVRPAITADTLHGVKPDFADSERKAWRVVSLVPEAGTVEAVGATGLSVKFKRPMPEGFEPVLYLTRRGEVIVAALDPKEPFPRWHGEGGRLHRAGDSLPRIQQPAKLEITKSTP
jgi:hypothetical protein